MSHDSLTQRVPHIIMCTKKKKLNLYLFPCKNYSFWGLLSVFWFVKRHSFKPHALHFQLNYECDVIFAVPQICAYFEIIYKQNKGLFVFNTVFIRTIIWLTLSGLPDNGPD
jgi:hypothetical protein